MGSKPQKFIFSGSYQKDTYIDSWRIHVLFTLVKTLFGPNMENQCKHQAYSHQSQSHYLVNNKKRKLINAFYFGWQEEVINVELIPSFVYPLPKNL